MLTRKYIQSTLFHQNSINKNGKKSDIVSLSHSILKRYIRLLIPTFASILLCWFIHCLASFEDRLKVANLSQSGWFTEKTGIQVYGRPQSLIWVFIVSFFSVWTNGYVAGFNNVLWTINIELKGSFMVFLLVSIVAPEHGIQNSWLAIVMLLLYFLSPFVISDYYIMMASFIFGFFYAMKADKTIFNECSKFFETHFNYIKIDQTSKVIIHLRKVISLIYLLFIICVVWDFACIPQMGSEFYKTTWWNGHQKFMSKYVGCNGFGNIGAVSTSFFFELLGSVLLFHALDISPFLQSLFSVNPMLYLGKISFSLYLVHLPLLYAVSPEIFIALYGNGEKVTYDYSVASTFVIMLPIWWFVAHCFWYLFDRNAVAWSNRLVEYVFPPMTLTKNENNNKEQDNDNDIMIETKEAISITHVSIDIVST